MKDIQEILDSIKTQREKQIEKGYTVDHDLQYKNGQLLLAALTLVGFAHGQTSGWSVIAIDPAIIKIQGVDGVPANASKTIKI